MHKSQIKEFNEDVGYLERKDVEVAKTYLKR